MVLYRLSGESFVGLRSSLLSRASPSPLSAVKGRGPLGPSSSLMLPLSRCVVSSDFSRRPKILGMSDTSIWKRSTREGVRKGSSTERAKAAAGGQNGASRAPVFLKTTDARDLEEPAQGFDKISDALRAISRGEIVVVLDDEDRENEGDLILAADHATPEAMAFVVNHTSGVVCVGMEGSDLDRLRIPLMVPPNDNEEAMSTAFTVTVDLREGTTTGISASDRAATIKALACPSSRPEDFKRPGHIFPLRYRQGGVLRRPGHTEASVDLARLAGCRPAGVLCEVVCRDGEMARTPELRAFAAEHGLCCITIADLVRYRLKNDKIVQRTASGEIPTRYGRFMAHAYRSLLDGTEHIALVVPDLEGNINSNNAYLARIHSESMLGDVFGSQRCNSGAQLDAALCSIVAEGRGVLVYLRGQQGRGMGLTDELQAYSNSTPEICASGSVQADDFFPPDLRDYGVAAHILKDLGIGKVRMLTSNSTKVSCMRAHGIVVDEVIPLMDQNAINFGMLSAGTHV